ncbi:HTATIP2, partial [Symbiodinium sp. CCMP2456]
MPGYRLYKSLVAGATGHVGEALTRQLLLSPLCETVHTLVRRKTGAFKELSAAAKLHQHIADFRNDDCGVEASALDGVDAAFCVLGARSGWSDAADVAAVERDAVINFA